MCLLVVAKPTEQMLSRIRMLRSFQNVSVEVMSRFGSRHDVLGKLARIRHRGSVIKLFLKRNQITLIVHEWWDGIAGTNPEEILSFRTRWFADFPLQLQFVAKTLRIPVVTLPHGHAMKELSIGSAHARRVSDANNGRLPFGNRDSFAAYVVAHRTDFEFLTLRTDMTGENVRVWGSARFSPRWVASLYSTVEPFPGDSNTRKVLFFLPKWHNMIDRAGTLRLLSALSQVSEIALWVREHPRKSESQLSDDERQQLSRMPSVRLIESSVDSARLILGCDVLVEVESSIVIDAVLLGKRVVMPRYLQDASVVSRLDRTRAVVRTQDLESTLAAVRSNDLPPVPDEEFLVGVAAQVHADTLAFYDTALCAVQNQRDVSD